MNDPLSFSERRDWLRLIRTPTVGPVAFDTLITRYGSASEALLALPSLAKRRAALIPPIEDIEAEMEACENFGVHIIAACEPNYPALLRQLDPPPPIITVRGDIELAARPCVAIIGSRNASAIGQTFARNLSHALGEAGIVVVSGLARGIDTQAHHAALETGTIAVLGGGVDHVYPSQNSELYAEIVQKGCLVSESPLGHRATAKDFPRRNRIISGLSLGVVVVEAAERSGTLITARYAAEQNRDVMAVPGSPLDPRAQGCNRLIREGAALIENADDVINIIQGLRESPLGQSVSDSRDTHYRQRIHNIAEVKSQPKSIPTDQEMARIRQSVLDLLSTVPTPKDDIIRLSQAETDVVLAVLLELEINDGIHVEPDGRIGLKV